MKASPVISIIERHNNEFVSKFLKNNQISKEEMKDFIEDLLRECEDDECEWIVGRLNADY